MCRGRIDPDTHVLGQVRAVVLDEIHLLHGTARGEMVRWLFERLARFLCRPMGGGAAGGEARPFQVVALSATVRDPGAVMGVYCPAGTLVEVPGTRPIEVVGGPDTVRTEDAILAYLGTLARPEKILVFCNSRARVDQLALEMRGPLEYAGCEVISHHGSLGKGIREAAETRLRRGTKVVAFATSTLELGIDIGDIDLVVLDGPPPDTASFLQRIGRGNRRTGTTRVMQCSANRLEEVVAGAMVCAAQAGELCAGPTGPQYAVSVQQMASYIFQSPLKRARPRAKLVELIQSRGDPCLAEGLLDHLVEIGHFEEGEDGVRLGESWLEKTETGGIHSVIEAAKGYTVVDAKSGETVATGVEYRGEGRLGVGGHGYDVSKVTGTSVEVQRTAGRDNGEQARYRSRRSMLGGSHPLLVRWHLGIPDEVWPVISSRGRDFAFHLGGFVGRTILNLVAKRAGADVQVNDWYAELPEGKLCPPAWIIDVSLAQLALHVDDRLESLEAGLGRPFANRWLPRELRRIEIESWLSLDDELSRIAGSQWTWDFDPAWKCELAGVLECLAS
jgi:ATP-dependent Lhr-like helicase